MAKVRFNKLSKQFSEDSFALHDFDLRIEDGEFMVLVGPSGCGKSTALRLLAGLETVTAGEILLDDRCINQDTPQQRNIAMVFQNYALYPHMTVRANLEFPLRMRHMPTQEIANKVSYIAGILDLSELLERKPKQLSGGQRQRVAMGRALVRDPSVFLLDEPLSNLDARLRAQIRADIAQLQRRLNKTTLYVTHDQVEAMTLGDRVAVMNAGELQQVGTPETLYRAPQNIFVAKFIGSPGMNIIPARLIKTEQGLAASIGSQTFPLVQPGENLHSYLDQPISLGIRPEAVSLKASVRHVGIKIKPCSTEYLGHESLVYFQIPETATDETGPVFIARLAEPMAHVEMSDKVLFVDPAVVYIFDEMGQSIHTPLEQDTS